MTFWVTNARTTTKTESTAASLLTGLVPKGRLWCEKRTSFLSGTSVIRSCFKSPLLRRPYDGQVFSSGNRNQPRRSDCGGGLGCLLVSSQDNCTRVARNSAVSRALAIILDTRAVCRSQVEATKH